MTQGNMRFGDINESGSDQTRLYATPLSSSPGVERGKSLYVLARQVFGPNVDPTEAIRGFSVSRGGVGVVGEAAGINGTGVLGVAHNGPASRAIFGYSKGGNAGRFLGTVEVVGTLFKSNLAFKIDHPLDPENKYLYHSGMESPDMKNLYDGIVQLDEEGSAWVELPEWFEELNRGFRYHLTAIGGPAPDLHIAEEITGNRFRVAGGSVGMRISWQVTGIRQDPWAESNRLPVEEEKSEDERGTYLHPEVYGKPETSATDYKIDKFLWTDIGDQSTQS
jgi:hypothetical protein